MSQRNTNGSRGLSWSASPPQPRRERRPGGELNTDVEVEVFGYHSSDNSKPDCPGPDRPPRLPSPSNESHVSERSGSPYQPRLGPRAAHDEDTATKALPFISRHALAQRLARIARQLATTTDEELPVDTLLLTEQVNQVELTLLGVPPPSSSHHPGKDPSLSQTASLSNTLASQTRSAPRSQASPSGQAAVSATAAQLSEDLETLHHNLRARHEEATHIQAILLSRLELAAQRILFLQRLAEDLEHQLRESDDELGHLRILLKALEIQVPEHPDEDLRKCLVRVREEFWAVRKRRETLRRKNAEDGAG
ncbi:hypothetical protein NLU13_8387 [Sarocladium strictum]|uniref:Uncharacterized protein n=1 Tax=Sarocladium strictum TaxID=5046 RepID=A0AA39GC82_SARSR|nr:hypothetical protein NLU13_8387 [Sarocladium strictum]